MNDDLSESKDLTEETNLASEEAQEAQTEGYRADDNRQWYVIHCYSGYENKVRKNLEQRIETMGMKNKIFEVIIPRRKRSKFGMASAARWNAMFSRGMSW